MHQIGEYAALAVALCWTLSALFFEKAGHKIGSFSVNIIRLVMAFLLLGITLMFTQGYFIPMHGSIESWAWLGLSGVVGLFLGDMFLFESYTIIGSRTSTLIMSTVPVLTSLMGWIFLNEHLSGKEILAILIVVSGIFIAIADKRLKIKVPAKGLLFAFGGATGQAIGLILSKKGMGDFDAISATQIRIVFGAISFALFFTYIKRWGKIFSSLKDKNALKNVSIGAFFGPFIGIALSLFAIQHTNTGIASTLMSLVPILIIVPSARMFNEKITPHQVIGAVISLIGVSLIFI